MQARKVLSVIVIVLCVAIFGCKDRAKGLSSGQYSVSIETIEDHGSLLVQRITLTTTSNRQVVLAEPGGRESSSAGPSTMENEKTADYDITLTVSTARPSATIKERQAIVSLVITDVRETAGGTTRTTRFAQMSMPIEESQTLEDVITKRDTAGVFTDKQSILRIESDQRYIELYVE